MKDKAKYFITRIITVAAAALLVYGYIKLPTDGLDYHYGKYSAVDTKTDLQTEDTVNNSGNDVIPAEDGEEDIKETPAEKEEQKPATDVTPAPEDREEENVEDNPTEDTPPATTDEESVKEDTSQEEELWDESIELISLTKKVTAGSSASIKIKGKPNTEYTIYVYYSSGASKAKGLEPQTSNGNGYAEWEWKVGVRTKAGTYRIEITDGSITVKTTFEVS